MNTGNVPASVGSCPLILKLLLHVVALLPWPVYVAVNAVVVSAWLTSPGSPLSLMSGAGSISSVQAAVTRASESRQRSVVVMAHSPVAKRLPATCDGPWIPALGSRVRAPDDDTRWFLDQPVISAPVRRTLSQADRRVKHSIAMWISRNQSVPILSVVTPTARGAVAARWETVADQLGCAPSPASAAHSGASAAKRCFDGAIVCASDLAESDAIKRS